MKCWAEAEAQAFREGSRGSVCRGIGLEQELGRAWKGRQWNDTSVGAVCAYACVRVHMYVCVCVPLAGNQHWFYFALYLRNPNKTCQWKEGMGKGREQGKEGRTEGGIERD